MDGHWPIQDLAIFLLYALVVIEMKRGGFWFWRISAWILLACFDSDRLWAVQRLKDTWAGLRRPFVPSGTGPLLLWLVRVLSCMEGLGFGGLILLPFEMVIIICTCRLFVTNFLAKVASEIFFLAFFTLFMLDGAGETFSLFWQIFKVLMHAFAIFIVLVIFGIQLVQLAGILIICAI